jgi:hypothetical protein
MFVLGYRDGFGSGASGMRGKYYTLSDNIYNIIIFLGEEIYKNGRWCLFSDTVTVLGRMLWSGSTSRIDGFKNQQNGRRSPFASIWFSGL